MELEQILEYLLSDNFFIDIIQTTLYMKKYTESDILYVHELIQDDNKKTTLEAFEIMRKIRRQLQQVEQRKSLRRDDINESILQCCKRIAESFYSQLNIDSSKRHITNNCELKATSLNENDIKYTNKYSILELYIDVALVDNINLTSQSKSSQRSDKEKRLYKISRSEEKEKKYLDCIRSHIIDNIYDIVSEKDKAFALFLKSLILTGLRYDPKSNRKAIEIILIDEQRLLKEEYKKTCIHEAKKNKSKDRKTGGIKLNKVEEKLIIDKVSEDTHYFIDTNINGSIEIETIQDIFDELYDVVELVTRLSVAINFELDNLLTQVCGIKTKHDSFQTEFDLVQYKNDIKILQENMITLVDQICREASQLELIFCKKELEAFNNKLKKLNSIVNPTKGKPKKGKIEIVITEN